MVDFVVSLRSQWASRVPIYAMSRRGLLPQAHRPVSALTLKREDIPFGAEPRSRCGDGCGTRRGQCRPWGRLAKRGRWHSSLHLGDLAKPPLQIPSSAFSAMRAPGGKCTGTAWRRKWSGRSKRPAGLGELRIIAAKTFALVPSASLARITYRRRGGDKTETLDVAKVAECTGVYTIRWRRPILC